MSRVAPWGLRVLFAALCCCPALALACGSGSRLLRVDAAGQLQLALMADSDYRGWIEEQGQDLAIEFAAGRVDSSPGRWVREPWQARSAADGRLRLQLRGLAAGQALQLHWRCAAEQAPAQAQRWNAWFRAGLASGRYWTASRPLHGLQTMLALLVLQWRLDRREDPAIALWVDQQWAAIARRAGQPQLAAQAYARLRQRHAGQVSAVTLAMAELGQGQALIPLGSAEADPHLASAEQVLRAAGQPWEATVAAQDRCVLLRMNSDPAAVDCLAAVAARFAALGDPAQQLLALSNRATALDWFGRYREAAAQVEQGLALARAHADPRLTAGFLRMQARLSSAAGDYERALVALDDALALYRQLNDVLWSAQIERLIGDVYALGGEPRRALDYYAKAYAVFAERDIRPRRIALRLTQSRTLEQLGELDTALAYASEANALAEPSASAADRSTANLRLIDLLIRSGQSDAALGLWQRSAAAIPWTPAELAIRDRQRAALQATSVDAALDARLHEHRERAYAEGQLQEALETAAVQVARLQQQGQAEAAQPLIEQAFAHSLPVLAGLHSNSLRQLLLARLRELLLSELPQRSTPLPSAVAEHWLARLEQLRAASARRAALDPNTEQAMQALERGIADSFLDNAELSVNPQRQRSHLRLIREWQAQTLPAATDSTQSDASRPASSADLLLLLAQGGRVGWLLRHEGAWRWTALGAAGPLNQALAELRHTLALGHVEQAQLQQQLDALTERLQLATLLPSSLQRLDVLTDPMLSGIPLELLLERDRPQLQLRWLQSSRPIHPRRISSLQLLAAGDALGVSSLPALAAVEAEFAAVSAAWPALPQQRVSNLDVQQLRRGLRDPHALVHIAAHGMAARQLEEESGLWLLDGEQQTPRFVSALRLRSWPVQAPMIVLSACEAGYSGAFDALRMGGVGNALLDAGAQAVIGNRWPIGDRAARLFAEYLHQALAEHPDQPARALRAARAQLRSQRAFRHPVHWAGWYLIQRGPQQEDAS